MRITVYYENGLTEDFDTMNFTAAEPFKLEKDRNILTDFLLRFDMLATKGLILDFCYYDITRDSETKTEWVEEIHTALPIAARRAGWRIELLSKKELEKAVLIVRDGEIFAWKQGEEWINAVKFRLQEILCFSSASTDSTNRKATVLFAYLQKANPTLSDAEIADMMGFSLEAYQQIQEWETENTEFDDDLSGLFAAISDQAFRDSEDAGGEQDAGFIDESDFELEDEE